MDLDVVSFPALLIADDGWVCHLYSRDELDQWTASAIKTYNHRSVILYDNSDSAWKVETIAPRKRLGFLAALVHRLSNSKLPVQIQLRPITESPLDRVQEILSASIDADDDILTQYTDAQTLKQAVKTATSYEGLVGVLRRMHAI